MTAFTAWNWNANDKLLLFIAYLCFSVSLLAVIPTNKKIIQPDLCPIDKSDDGQCGENKPIGNPAEVISYADKANTRMRSKCYRLIRHGKKRNIAVAAIARKLACFV